MKFEAKHTRSFAGNDVSVTVSADENESITMVSVSLDGASLEEKPLSEGTEQYIGEFSGVGDAAPGKKHELLVAAWDQSNRKHSSTTQWTDLI